MPASPWTPTIAYFVNDMLGPGANYLFMARQLGYDGTDGHNRAFMGVIVKADNAA